MSIDLKVDTSISTSHLLSTSANSVSRARMKEYLGWVQDSDMASTYVHLSGHDLDNSLLRLNNIQVEEEARAADRFALQKCSTCSLDNPPGNQFCSRFGTILDENKAEEIMKRQMERQQADDFMSCLVQDKEFQAFLDRKSRAIGTLKV